MGSFLNPSALGIGVDIDLLLGRLRHSNMMQRVFIELFPIYRQLEYPLYMSKFLGGDIAKQIYIMTTDVNMAHKATNFYRAFLNFPGKLHLNKFKDAAAQIKGDMKFLREAVSSERTRGFDFSIYGLRPTQVNIF